MPEYQNIEIKQGETFSMNLNFATEIAAGTYSLGDINSVATFSNATVQGSGVWDATEYGDSGPYLLEQTSTSGSGTGIKCRIRVTGNPFDDVEVDFVGAATLAGNNYAVSDTIVFTDPGGTETATVTVATLTNEYAAALRSTHSSEESDKFVLTWINANEIKMSFSDEKTRDLSDTFTGYWDLLHKDYPASGDYSRILQGEVFVYPQITIRADIP